MCLARTDALALCAAERRAETGNGRGAGRLPGLTDGEPGQPAFGERSDLAQRPGQAQRGTQQTMCDRPQRRLWSEDDERLRMIMVIGYWFLFLFSVENIGEVGAGVSANLRGNGACGVGAVASVCPAPARREDVIRN